MGNHYRPRKRSPKRQLSFFALASTDAQRYATPSLVSIVLRHAECARSHRRRGTRTASGRRLSAVPDGPFFPRGRSWGDLCNDLGCWLGLRSAARSWEDACHPTNTRCIRHRTGRTRLTGGVPAAMATYRAPLRATPLCRPVTKARAKWCLSPRKANSSFRDHGPCLERRPTAAEATLSNCRPLESYRDQTREDREGQWLKWAQPRARRRSCVRFRIRHTPSRRRTSCTLTPSG